MNQTTSSIQKPVQVWLLIGVVMVFLQVVIGGVTRLTDSGLSITEWEVIQGTLPPMNPEAWEEAFEAYKVAAKKQYETLHADMTMQEFKFIYFWEYFHRLWARLIGLVFLFPFLFFLVKKWLPRWLIKRLGIVIALAAAVASFGWIMVASGLHDDSRTWVSAYKLIIHLSLATVLFGYLFWTWRLSVQTESKERAHIFQKRLAWATVIVLMIQIVFGGLMAGMRAGLLHPYFPMFVEGGRLMDALGSQADLGVGSFIDYEPAASVKALVQIVHRATAYLLVALSIWLGYKTLPIASKNLRQAYWLFTGMLGLQFLLGVLTVINCFGKVPVGYGVLHQAGALILLATILHVCFQFRTPSA